MSKPDDPGESDPFVEAVRGRLQHEFMDPGSGELELTIVHNPTYINPTIMAVAQNLSRSEKSRYVAIFTIDRDTFDEATTRGADPIAVGELVFVHSEHADLVARAIAAVFPGRT
ncbi:MAG: hypothetical protein KF878_38130 [Planctomycetes bacterium]|nr:hypothetical protein [Planctomycetota bacterium]MCW8137754.1 hypothetical protein [Planctomycetota bacterium]